MTDARMHIGNVSDNLEMLADFACATTTLLVPTTEGLRVKDSVRPTTVALSAPLRPTGEVLDHADAVEAYACLASGELAVEAKMADGGGIACISYAHPIGVDALHGVVVRDVLASVAREFGSLEESFVNIALQLLKLLRRGLLRDASTLDPFSTTHSASDAVIHLGVDRTVLYATPNVRSLLPPCAFGDVDSALRVFPAYEQGVVAALAGAGCSRADLELNETILAVRTLPLALGAVVLLEDVTELRVRERELRVKEATIREVHHRVKNNLQTIESLLRMQMRRSGSIEVKDAFSEAITRVSAMAVAHEMLSYASNESVEVAPLVQAIAERVRDGLVGATSTVSVQVDGQAGYLDACGSSSFALTVAEIVHNAIEHGLEGREGGRVLITLSCAEGVLRATVEDDGCGLPEGFQLDKGQSMGLALMRTLVEDDLAGCITCGRATRLSGAQFSVQVPLLGDD